jgi:hypothetical protein
MPNFRRGAAEITAAAERKGGGSFRSFVPQIKWDEDKEEKFLLFLNPIEEVPVVQYHDFIPVGKGEKANGEEYTRWESFISRKDPAIGEDYDDLQDRLDVWPKERMIAVAVELEPTIVQEGRRKRVTGFEVATETFTRTDEEGNETEVVAPKVGLVIQASANFFGWLVSFDASSGPIEQTPFQVIRRGKNSDTAYDFIALEGREVDLSGLMENLDGISYARDFVEDLTLTDDEADNAVTLGNALLNKRLEELADGDRYEELVSPIQHIEQKYPHPKSKAGQARAAKKGKGGGERPQRARKNKTEREAEPEAVVTEATPTETTRERFAALKAQVENPS